MDRLTNANNSHPAFLSRAFGEFFIVFVLYVVFVIFPCAALAQGSRTEVAFSPSGGAQGLVIKVIESARQEVNMLAYSFTSAQVAEALVRAAKRGVRVRLAIDSESNMNGAGASSSRAALSAVTNAGGAVRLVDTFAIHHDKVLIVDGLHVQTGSFNYSSSAEKRNSENVLVIWDDDALARAYLKHFERNWGLGKAFVLRY